MKATLFWATNFQKMPTFWCSGNARNFNLVDWKKVDKSHLRESPRSTRGSTSKKKLGWENYFWKNQLEDFKKNSSICRGLKWLHAPKFHGQQKIILDFGFPNMWFVYTITSNPVLPPSPHNKPPPSCYHQKMMEKNEGLPNSAYLYVLVP